MLDSPRIRSRSWELPWLQDVEYLNHTSLKTYFPYMMGGGYVLSADLAHVILGINQQSAGHDLLKFMPNEDVSVGFWLMSVDLRRIDHPRVVRLPLWNAVQCKG